MTTVSKRQIGARVQVRKLPDGGEFTGTITALNTVRMVVTPEYPAVQAVFPKGYDIGKAHWREMVVIL